jgi:3-deoxy-D-manno-octulosonate 8-phosphate phosphatase (KDO 8-P phosphatase)
MILSDKNLKEKVKNIKIFLFDLDGVLILRKDRNEAELLKCMEEFTQKLKLHNYYAGVITARNDDNLTQKLSLIENCIVVTASFNKVESVDKIIKKLDLEFLNVLYIGDDMLDIPLLQKSGIAIAPSSARREVKRIVDFTVDINLNGSILHSVLEMIESLRDE